MFTRGVKNGLLRGWKLILAGGLLSSDDKYFKSITSKTNGLPIQCIANISFTHLQELYANSSIYWHAAGYGETNPQYMEHFGMTTVEAMAAECIPIVYNAGGQPEIIEHEKSGYIWNTQDECLLYTQKVIHSEKMREDMQAQAKQRAELFSIELFYRRFDALLFAFEKKNNV
jgi:glycosyltransferase involved in cell wall biosynthesis